MALTAVGALGTGGGNAGNYSTFPTTTTATLEAANIGVIIIAVDNNQTTDGDEGGVSGVVDSAGNTWLKGAEFTNGQGTAQAGALCSVWYVQAATQLASGGTVTASFTNNTSRDAVSTTLHEFTVTAGSTIALEGTPGTLANDSADPGSLNVTTANIECLRIRGVASEQSARTLTATASWTKFTDGAASGGAGANGMCANGEFLISTATGAASDPSVSALDCASVYIALKEVVAAAATTKYLTLLGVGT